MEVHSVEDLRPVGVLQAAGDMKRCVYILLVLTALTLGACSSKKAVATKGRTATTDVVVHVVPSTDRQVAELIRQARTWIGTPYQYGGHTRKKGTDCSGMIMELFLSVYDLKLPRSSAMQHDFSRPVKFDDMKPGDLVFFTTDKSRSRINHVGLYIGDNRMIHASGSRGVMESGLSEKYWVNVYHSSGRVIDTDARRKKKEEPAKVVIPSVPLNRLQELYNALDEQIDSIYVADPEIFD